MRLEAPQLSTPARRSGPFYGWYIVGSAFLANVAFSEQFNASFGVFLQQMGAETGWARSALVGAKTLSRFPEVLVLPFLGPMIDRYGGRRLMLVGALLYGGAMMALSQVQDIWQLYLFLGVLVPLGGAGFGGIVVGVAVSNWFVSRRGRAVGIAAMGTSFGTMVTPLAASALIEGWGWRQTWLVLGLSAFILVIPAMILIRRRPEDLGMHPDGIGPEDAAIRLSAHERERRSDLLAADVRWTRRQLIGTPVLWLISIAWGVAGFALAGSQLHMVPFLQEQGYPLVLAAGAVSLRATLGLLGNPLVGYLAERVPIRLIASIQFVVAGLGVALWLLPPSPLSLLVGLLLVGLASGGSQVALELIWATFFGRLSLGTVRGMSFPIQAALTATGPITVSLLYDGSGSYQIGFTVMALVALLAAGLLLFARPPRQLAS